MAKVIAKNGTITQYLGLKQCSLCEHKFEKEEQFRVIEEDGSFDNDWFAVCKTCLEKPIYNRFILSNCTVTK